VADVVSWAESAILWHLYPLGSSPTRPRDGSSEGAGLPGEAWLDYLIELGCSGLQLGPVFASESHGYDTVDHLRIDPRLGDDTDFDRLVAAAHDRGIRVVLDGVFNHVGRSHPRFQAALAEGPTSPSGAWFRWVDGPDGPRPQNFEGHDTLVALNHDHQPVIDHVVEVMNHWLDRGADGWRLDAAYQVPAAFWATALPRVRDRHPQAWFVGEMIHGDYPGYVAGSGLDSVTQYELWKAIWSSINDVNFFELSWALQRHAEFVRAFLPQTFVGNHDVTRIASRIDDERHLAAAIALLFLLPGIPSIYYGDEIGLHAIKEDRAGGDDAIRPELPATPEDLQPEVPGLRDLHKTFISIRRRHPWLVDAELTVADVSNGSLVLIASPARADGPDESLLLALNLTDRPAPVDAAGRPATELASSAPGRPVDAVPPHGWTVLRLAPAGA
jgi:glycosidase